MADTLNWGTTKRAWVDAEGVAGADFNRMETNSEYFKHMSHFSHLFSGFWGVTSLIPRDGGVARIPFSIPPGRNAVVARCSSSILAYVRVDEVNVLVPSVVVYPIIKIADTLVFSGEKNTEIYPETAIYGNNTGSPYVVYLDIQVRVSNWGGLSVDVDFATLAGYIGLTIRA